MVHNKMLVGKRVTRMCKVWRDMFDLYKLETELLRASRATGWISSYNTVIYGEILPADMADFASVLFQYFSSSNINISAKNWP